MNTIQNIIRHLYGPFVFIRQVLGYSRFFIVALLSPRAKLAARLLASESQLAIYNHRISQKKKPRPRFNPAFRFLWVLLGSPSETLLQTRLTDREFSAQSFVEEQVIHMLDGSKYVRHGGPCWRKSNFSLFWLTHNHAFHQHGSTLP
jgi:hypothetical protein